MKSFIWQPEDDKDVHKKQAGMISSSKITNLNVRHHIEEVVTQHFKTKADRFSVIKLKYGDVPHLSQPETVQISHLLFIYS